MNRNFIFSSLIIAVCVNLGIIGCHRKGDAETPNEKKLTASTTPVSEPVNADTINSNAVLEIRTFQNGPKIGGYGYDIFMDSELYVHQPHIPAVAGNRGFVTEENARRAGELVAYKIRNKIMPPSVTQQELDSLGVLH